MNEKLVHIETRKVLVINIRQFSLPIKSKILAATKKACETTACIKSNEDRVKRTVFEIGCRDFVFM